MATVSVPILIVDPDGDLVLLLAPTPPKISNPNDSYAASDTSDFDGLSETTHVETVPSTELELSKEEITIDNSRVLVSSKHMSLASPVFKAMLQGSFQEGLTLKTKGKLEVPLLYDDPAAMRILLAIIHGRINTVPLKIDLGTFTQIAILVDKYQCPESVQLLPPIWSKALSNTWFGYGTWADIASWMCIAWQFKLDDEFFKAAQVIQDQSTCSLEEIMKQMKYTLPIPKVVIGKSFLILSMILGIALTFQDELESRRLKDIRKAIRILKDVITKYCQEPTPKCTLVEHPFFIDRDGKRRPAAGDILSHRIDCDSMVLGSLTKSVIENGIFPLPEPPYTSWSFESFVERVEDLEVNTLCFKMTGREADKHDFIGQLKRSIHNIEKSTLTLANCKELSKKV